MTKAPFQEYIFAFPKTQNWLISFFLYFFYSKPLDEYYVLGTHSYSFWASSSEPYSQLLSSTCATVFACLKPQNIILYLRYDSKHTPDKLTHLITISGKHFRPPQVPSASNFISHTKITCKRKEKGQTRSQIHIGAKEEAKD